MDVELREVREFLASHAPFDRLPPEVVDRLPRQCTVRYVRRGTDVLEPGREGDGLYIVRAGAIDISDDTGGLVSRIDVGGAFGMSTLLEGRPSALRCTALEDTLLLVLAPEAFSELVRDHPAVTTFFASAHHDRLARAIDNLQQAASGGVVLGTTVGDLVKRPPVTCGPDDTVREAARTMSEAAVSSLAIVEAGHLVGILTDRDLRNRVLAAGLPVETPVRQVMTPDPVRLPIDALAIEALMEMVSRNIHHLPLVDHRDRPAGLITITDLIRRQQTSPVFLATDVARAPTLEAAVEQAHRIPVVVGQLVDQDATAGDLLRVITAMGDAVRRRVLALAEQEVVAELGPVPTSYAWVVLGSVAREEEALSADQDHALVLAEPGHDAWFARLAERVTEALEQAGWHRCLGDIMATNPAWRLTPGGWSEQFQRWAEIPAGEGVLHAATFYDMRHLAGDGALTARVRDSVVTSERVLKQLAVECLRMQPPLGFFRGFVLEQEGEHRDLLDIKRGIAAVVLLARVYALRVGSTALTTRDRLHAASDHGLLSTDETGDLLDALELMSYRRLRHQVDQVRAGRAPDNHLDPRTLTERQRRHLRDAFTIVRHAQNQLGHWLPPGFR